MRVVAADQNGICVRDVASDQEQCLAYTPEFPSEATVPRGRVPSTPLGLPVRRAAARRARHLPRLTTFSASRFDSPDNSSSWSATKRSHRIGCRLRVLAQGPADRLAVEEVGVGCPRPGRAEEPALVGLGLPSVLVQDRRAGQPEVVVVDPLVHHRITVASVGAPRCARPRWCASSSTVSHHDFVVMSAPIAARIVGAEQRRVAHQHVARGVLVLPLRSAPQGPSAAQQLVVGRAASPRVRRAAARAPGGRGDAEERELVAHVARHPHGCRRVAAPVRRRHVMRRSSVVHAVSPSEVGDGLEHLGVLDAGSAPAVGQAADDVITKRRELACRRRRARCPSSSGTGCGARAARRSSCRRSR